MIIKEDRWCTKRKTRIPVPLYLRNASGLFKMIKRVLNEFKGGFHLLKNLGHFRPRGLIGLKFEISAKKMGHVTYA